jgi:UDPglucose--hexose-1-phosphate uridylyltransferase
MLRRNNRPFIRVRWQSLKTTTPKKGTKKMGELRKDYFFDRYVIISPERAKRPHDFQQHPMEPVKATPFTPGNEAQMPPIALEYPAGPQWQCRVIPNKFAIVRPEGQVTLSTNNLYTWSNNFGYHEIVIEGQKDGISAAELGPQGIAAAIKVATMRVQHLAAQPNIHYVAYFKNERPEAGASINHPHSQIIATALTPPGVQQRYDVFSAKRAEYGFSPLYKVLDFERGGQRMVRESKHFAVLCPYASRFAFEVLIIPLRDSYSYTTLTDEERDDLAVQLHAVTSKLAGIGAPFNIEWFHSHTQNGFHWHIAVTPRLNVWAGFELETGIIVNPLPPENAAAFYRE